MQDRSGQHAHHQGREPGLPVRSQHPDEHVERPERGEQQGRLPASTAGQAARCRDRRACGPGSRPVVRRRTAWARAARRSRRSTSGGPGRCPERRLVLPRGTTPRPLLAQSDPTQLRSSRRAGVPGLLRVELRGAQRAVLDGGDEAVARRGSPRSPGARGCGRWSAGSSRGRRRSARSRTARCSTPSNSAVSAGVSTVFQPMCGTTGACSRSTTPGHSSRPGVSTPCSTPRANSTCMPTQMPSTLRPPASRRPTTSWPRTARMPSTHAGRRRRPAPPGRPRPSPRRGRRSG